MPTDQYHEPPSELSEDSRTFVRRRVALRKILFRDGDTVELAEQAEDEVED